MRKTRTLSLDALPARIAPFTIIAVRHLCRHGTGCRCALRRCVLSRYCVTFSPGCYRTYAAATHDSLRIAGTAALTSSRGVSLDAFVRFCLTLLRAPSNTYHIRDIIVAVMRRAFAFSAVEQARPLRLDYRRRICRCLSGLRSFVTRSLRLVAAVVVAVGTVTLPRIFADDAVLPCRGSGCLPRTAYRSRTLAAARAPSFAMTRPAIIRAFRYRLHFCRRDARTRAPLAASFSSLHFPFCHCNIV